MGGWELIIALFGGAWYVISAITAANEKKKKKAKRKLALEAESMSLDKDGLSSQQDKNAVSLTEKSRAADMISEALPRAEASFAKPINKPVSTPKVSGKEVGIMREARKAILDSMRKELGLPTQGQQPPQARPPRAKPLKVPVPTPMPAPTAVVNTVNTDRTETRKKPRRRPTPSRSLQQASGVPSGQALAEILKTRSGLKQAMILSEIFQPPVSQRSQHLS